MLTYFKWGGGAGSVCILTHSIQAILLLRGNPSFPFPTVSLVHSYKLSQKAGCVLKSITVNGQLFVYGESWQFLLRKTIGAFLLSWSRFNRWTPQTLPHLSSYSLWSEVALSANGELKPSTDGWFFSQGSWGLDNGKYETIILYEEQRSTKVLIALRNNMLYSKSTVDFMKLFQNLKKN